jgi:uncharacterized protein YegP (UPF0339 family)
MMKKKTEPKKKVVKTVVKKVGRKLTGPSTELTVIKIFRATLGKWEIYRMRNYFNGTLKKTEYGNRLVANNGNILTGNKGFNRSRGAIDNMKSVKASA